MDKSLYTPEQIEKEIKKLRKTIRCLVCDINTLTTTLYGYTTTTTTTTSTTTTTTAAPTTTTTTTLP